MSNFVSVTKYGLFDENGALAKTLGGQDIFNIPGIRETFHKLRSQYNISKIGIRLSDNPGTPLKSGNPSNNLGGNVWVCCYKEPNYIYVPDVRTKTHENDELVLNFVVYNCLTKISESEAMRAALGIKEYSVFRTALNNLLQRHI